jgi:hypothetical protein
LNEQLQPVSIIFDKKPGLNTAFGYQIMSGSFITNPYGRVQAVFGRDYPRSGTDWQNSPTPRVRYELTRMSPNSSDGQGQGLHTMQQ